MRTNIVIDDDIMQAAMRGSEFKTKKEAVEAGLKLLARQAHYREMLKWEGKLQWSDQPESLGDTSNMVMEAVKPYRSTTKAIQPSTPVKRLSASRRKSAGAI